jgi:integrase
VRARREGLQRHQGRQGLAAGRWAAFLSKASHVLSLAFLIAVWTGQRQGDLLTLTWTAYDGANIKLRQSKTGRYVVIPVGAPLKAALDAEPRRAVTILTTQAGMTWTADGFSASWRKVVSNAKVAGLTFHDLRGTAVLARAHQLHRAGDRDHNRPFNSRRSIDSRQQLFSS